jgi:single-stranded DNA-binding protein
VIADRADRMVTVNVVVLAGTVAADPVERTMPSGDEVAGVSCRSHDHKEHREAGRDLRPSV